VKSGKGLCVDQAPLGRPRFRLTAKKHPGGVPLGRVVAVRRSLRGEVERSRKGHVFGVEDAVCDPAREADIGLEKDQAPTGWEDPPGLMKKGHRPLEIMEDVEEDQMRDRRLA
jgi:hypothetical protein